MDKKNEIMTLEEKENIELEIRVDGKSFKLKGFKGAFFTFKLNGEERILSCTSFGLYDLFVKDDPSRKFSNRLACPPIKKDA